MENKSVVRCCVCARQIVSYGVSTDHKYCCNVPATRMWADQWCCKECSKDLDENGLFPEER